MDEVFRQKAPIPPPNPPKQAIEALVQGINRRDEAKRCWASPVPAKEHSRWRARLPGATFLR